jgi:transposase-like protein
MDLDRVAIVRDRLSGMTLTAVARKWGISRSLVCKLVKRSRADDEGFVLPPPQLVEIAHQGAAEAGFVTSEGQNDGR